MNTGYVAQCKEYLEGSGVRVCAAIGFPLGACASEVKAFETEYAYRAGCDEFDMVVRLGALQTGCPETVLADVQAVTAEAHGRPVKLILEMGLLSESEKILAARLASRTDVQYLGTCTGFSAGMANPYDVQLLKTHSAPGMKVKACGGVRTYPLARDLVYAGADRLGSCVGVQIAREEAQQLADLICLDENDRIRMWQELKGAFYDEQNE